MINGHKMDLITKASIGIALFTFVADVAAAVILQMQNDRVVDLIEENSEIIESLEDDYDD